MQSIKSSRVSSQNIAPEKKYIIMIYVDFFRHIRVNKIDQLYKLLGDNNTLILLITHLFKVLIINNNI